MPSADQQQYNQHKQMPPTGHQHYNQHQHLQQNQQKQTPPGGQVFDQQQQPSSSTKQQHQQVDRQQCLNAEAISEDKRAGGVHLQAARKANGSTDPNKSSQACQNKRGRDDPTSQTPDQRRKMPEGGIEVSSSVSTRRILHDLAFRLSSHSSWEWTILYAQQIRSYLHLDLAMVCASGFSTWLGDNGVAVVDSTWGISCVTLQANENWIKAYSPRVVKEYTAFWLFSVFRGESLLFQLIFWADFVVLGLNDGLIRASGLHSIHWKGLLNTPIVVVTTR